MSWQRSKETKRRYKKLYENPAAHYGSGVWYNEETGRYIRYWQPRRCKYYKNQANRAVRRYKENLPDKGSYKRVYEYWWSIW